MSERKEQQKSKNSYPSQTEDASQKGSNQNASANLDSTTDVDNDSVTTGRIAATERSSASSTKTNVTGSDLDGQTSF